MAKSSMRESAAARRAAGQPQRDPEVALAGNAELAAAARERAAAAAPGSLDRRGYGCTAVALSTTRTVTAARAVLVSGRLDLELRQAALDALGKLTEPERRP